MSISALSQSSYYYGYYQTKSNASQSATESESADTQESLLGAIAPKSGTKPPPPPEKMDFENMSDEDLQDFLTQMKELTGTIPGMEGDTTVDSLTDEQLQTVRDTLIEMSETMQGEGKKMPPPPEDVSSISDDDLISLLSSVKSYTGTIPGVEDSESLEVEDLTQEQLDSAREALAERQQEQFQNSMRQRMEEMLQNGGAYVFANLSTAYTV